MQKALSDSVSARQRCLSQMGVTQWYSRKQLERAAKTPECFYVELAEFDSFAASNVEKKSASLNDSLAHDHTPQSGESARSSLAALSSDLVGKNVPAVEPKKEREQAVESKSDPSRPALGELSERGLNPVQSFALNAYLASECLVLSEVQELSPFALEQRLLINILKSTGKFSHEQLSVDYLESFYWPVFRSLNLQAQQEGVLTEVFDAWVNRQRDSKSELYYFGKNYSSLSDRLMAQVDGVDVFIFEFSLQDMIQIPQRKREVWRQIQARFL